jgi:hypothetical protein
MDSRWQTTWRSAWIVGISLLAYALLPAMPIETSAITIKLPTTGQAHHALLLVPMGPLVFTLFLLPLLVSYGIARYLRARASVA